MKTLKIILGSIALLHLAAHAREGIDGRSATLNSPSVLNVQRKIAIGNAHNCALKTDGTVTCWGRNESGQLGNGSATELDGPVMVSGLSDVSFIAASFRHTCALKTDGSVACWGDNRLGLLAGRRHRHQSTYAGDGVRLIQCLVRRNEYSFYLCGKG